MTNVNQNREHQIQIKASDEVLKGVYANALQVTHNREEFIFDFMNIYPWQKMGMLNSRIIISPSHMKRMVKALQDNIKKYEDQFGPVEIGDDKLGQVGFQTD